MASLGQTARSPTKNSRTRLELLGSNPEPGDRDDAQPGAAEGSTTNETEEEYDARLEREERERLELQKKSLLQCMKDEAQVDPSTGIRYKGTRFHAYLWV